MTLPAATGSAAEHSLLPFVEEASDDLINLCSQLVSIPSPNPPGDTRAVAAFVRDHLHNLGLKTRTYAPDPFRPNLVAVIGGARPGPHILLNGHLDTFPPAEGNLEPYSGHAADGRIYGCGVGDMKAGIAISLVLASALARSTHWLRGRVTLAYVSDEETGGNLGTDWLLANAVELRDADFCYVLDQSGAGNVSSAEKGVLWLRIKTAGGGGHSAYGRSQSAIEQLIASLQALLGLRGQAVAGATPGVDQSAKAREVTINIGRIEGGVSPNLIATSAYADVDIRIPVGATCAWALAQATEAVVATGGESEIAVRMQHDPTLTDPSLVFVELLRSRVAEEVNREVTPAVRIGASDARLFRRAGIPAVVYGPSAHNLGAAGEYVEAKDLMTIARAYARTLSAGMRDSQQE